MKMSRGFTLIELIAVMVVLVVIGTIGTQFMVSAMENYQTSVSRGKLIADGRLAMERISRELRLALPNSVRVTDGGACLEFLPLVAAGSYLTDLPDSSNNAPAVSSFATSGYQLGLGTARYVAVGALSSAELYGVSSDTAALSSGESHSDNQLSLASTHRFIRNSLSKRFYLLDNPMAFCLRAGALSYHTGYGTPVTSTGSPAGAGSLLAEGVTGAAPFVVSAGTEDRNTVVAMQMSFSDTTESVMLERQVSIRNVP